MRRDRLVRLALAAAVVLGAGQVFLGAGLASAQGTDPAAPPATPPATPPPATPPPGGTTADPGLARQVTLTPPEMMAAADAGIARLESGRSSVAKQLAEARKQRDVVKTLCLNDKLNQLDVALRSATERRQNLELAVKRNDLDLANHETTILGVLRQRGDQLLAEANQCIGEEAGFAGDSAVTMTVEGVPEDDAPPLDFEIFVEPPLDFSPAQ